MPGHDLIGQPHNLVRHLDLPAKAFRDIWATLKANDPLTARVNDRRKYGDHCWVRAKVIQVPAALIRGPSLSSSSESFPAH